MKYRAIIILTGVLLIHSCNYGEEFFEKYNEEFLENIRAGEVLESEYFCPIDLDLRLLKSCNTSIANGTSEFIVVLYVPSDIPEDINKVEYSTTGGVFKSSGKNQASKKAIFSVGPGRGLLRIPADSLIYRRRGQRIPNMLVALDTIISGVNSGQFSLVAKVDGFQKTSRYILDQSLIDRIEISAPKFAIKNSSLDQITITAEGFGSMGMASAGEEVEFIIKLADGTLINEEWKFRDTRLSLDQKSTAETTFTVGDINYRGELQCIACSKTNQGICDTLVLQVVDD